jgi:hypothetical protein
MNRSSAVVEFVESPLTLGVSSAGSTRFCGDFPIRLNEPRS